MRYERVAMLGVVATLAVWAVTCKAGDGPPPPPGGPPSVDAGVDMRAETGKSTSFRARVTLPQGATASAYRWTVTWGDGAADSGTLGSTEQVAASHRVMGLDAQLVRDGTYFIVESGKRIAGCEDEVFPSTPLFIGATLPLAWPLCASRGETELSSAAFMMMTGAYCRFPLALPVALSRVAVACPFEFRVA